MQMREDLTEIAVCYSVPLTAWSIWYEEYRFCSFLLMLIGFGSRPQLMAIKLRKQKEWLKKLQGN